MSAEAAVLADRLRGGQRLRWLFVKLPCPAEVELAGASGFDAVVLDAEHGPADGLEHHLRAAAAAGIPALVRVPGVEAGPILRALDGGAAGIVVAHVESVAAAQAAVAAAHYPPRGRRGLALTTRAGRHGTASLAEHLSRARDETLVVVQLEDAEALPDASAILAVEGVDAVLIGATDLSISLGHAGDPGNPTVAAAIAAIVEAARRCRVPVATVVASAGEAASGSSQVAVFVSTLLIRDAFRSAAAPLGSGDSGGERPALVLLPGMLGTRALWEGVGPALLEPAAVRFGRIDLDASVEEMAASVLAAAPARFALAGHSLGGIVALAIVALAPERVTRLALLNTSANPPNQDQMAAWEALERDACEGDFRALATDFARANLPPSRSDEAELRGRVEAMATACGPRVLLRQLAAQRGRPDLRPTLGRVSCPTVVISGAQDTASPPARQEELAAAIPGAQLERLERVGHMSPLEAPERVARILSDWLRSER